MLETYNDVFQLIKESLFSPTEKSTLLENKTDWQSIYNEMLDQAVTALPYIWLKEHRLPDQDLQGKWMRSCDA